MKGSDFFKSVLTRNAPAISAVYAFAEGQMFANLKKLLTRYSPWGALGAQPDLDGFVASQVTTVAAAEALFENTKAVQRDLHRAIPGEVREGCFIVSTAPFKASLEAHVAAARASISRAVFASASADKDVIAEFTKNSREMLATHATSLSELGMARKKVCILHRMTCRHQSIGFGLCCCCIGLCQRDLILTVQVTAATELYVAYQFSTSSQHTKRFTGTGDYEGSSRHAEKAQGC